MFSCFSYPSGILQLLYVGRSLSASVANGNKMNPSNHIVLLNTGKLCYYVFTCLVNRSELSNSKQ